MKSHPRTYLLTFALTLALVGLTFRATAADDKSAIDPSGTWNMTLSNTNSQNRPSENILKLKMDAGTLTGTLNRTSAANGAAMTWEIKEAKVQGSDILFKVVNGTVTSSYKGTISGDTIKGTFEVDSSGKKYTRDWEAKRLKQ